MARNPIAEEYFGGAEGSDRTAIWFMESTGSGSKVVTVSRETKSAKHVWRTFQSAFLPEGYPDSVTKDYLQFQIWDTLQGLSSYIRGMLSTQAVLGALGVGGNTGNVLSATFTWFVRDLTGMMAGIMFAHFQGSKLDASAKQWRLAADFLNDIGMLMDLISPLFPRAFLFLLCLGSISRAITGTASGATRAALTQHFALRANAADISAKEGSQETMATLVGMMLGMLLAKVTTGRPGAVWLSFLALMLFHMYANFRAMRCLLLTTLNPERTAILLSSYLSEKRVLSPEQVSPQERMLPLPPLPSFLSPILGSPPPHTRVVMGARLSSLTLPNGWNSIQQLLARYRGEKHALICSGVVVHVIVHRDATSADLLRAYVHGLRLAVLLVESPEAGKIAKRPDGARGTDSAELAALHWMKDEYPSFIRKLETGKWQLDKVHLAAGEWRLKWN